MSDDGTSNSSRGRGKLQLPIEKIIAKKRLARAIEAAQKNGALVFLARHLKSQLTGKDAPVSTGQLEELIAQAARSIKDSSI